MPTTSELMIDRLLEWGVDTYFGLPGDGINNFYEAMRLRKDAIKFVHCRHEEEAALAAVGYAKFTGKPAVVVVTSGPGAVHILNGIPLRNSSGFCVVLLIPCVVWLTGDRDGGSVVAG